MHLLDDGLCTAWLTTDELVHHLGGPLDRVLSPCDVHLTHLPLWKVLIHHNVSLTSLLQCPAWIGSLRLPIGCISSLGFPMSHASRQECLVDGDYLKLHWKHCMTNLFRMIRRLTASYEADLCIC